MDFEGKKSISDKLSTLLAISLLLASITSIATFINLIPLAEASGTVGKALSFDGLDDYAAVPAIDANVYTFELWFKPETNFALIGSNRFLIQTADSSLTVWHDVYVGPQKWSSISIGTGAWYHLAVIVDYTTWQIVPYLNGTNLGAKPTTTNTKPSIGYTNIGSYSSSRFFNGLIDEVRIYDRALSGAEISTHYNSGNGQYGRPETGLMGLWHFDSDANDYSGNGNHGTVYGATYVDGIVSLPDVAIIDVAPQATKVLTGETVEVEVKTKNVGAGAYENFDVTVYYDGNPIDTKSVTGLTPGSEETLTYLWDTTGLLGTYPIKANTSIVQGETNTTNNEKIDGTVWIIKPPVASFTYSPDPAIENHTSTFDASGSTPNGGSIDNYIWEFDDGNTTGTANPIITHVYASHGTYNVTLTVEDNEGLNDTTWQLVQVLRHDVAVIDVTPYGNWTYEGWSISINVTVANEGNFTETVTVDLYYNITAGNKIGTKIIGLLPDETEILTFTWDTTSVKPCRNYTITANATIPMESDITDNLLNSTSKSHVRMLGDVTGDNAVRIDDVLKVASAFNSQPGDPRWDPAADLNRDGKIRVNDILAVALNFGKECP